ncbi:hypothetical protein B0T21DRAFT_343300 [Apiosordaria backusii]|uniref:Uncharacterized protein n=1 Tax=Apiosordaria backusii TaxID=314023 RepID=A0AA40K696_9PEZI|nr:hypothetical protein B0T21DRAFT_343300 [Apiosordaria backusii]
MTPLCQPNLSQEADSSLAFSSGAQSRQPAYVDVDQKRLYAFAMGSDGNTPTKSFSKCAQRLQVKDNEWDSQLSILGDSLYSMCNNSRQVLRGMGESIPLSASPKISVEFCLIQIKFNRFNCSPIVQRDAHAEWRTVVIGSAHSDCGTQHQAPLHTTRGILPGAGHRGTSIFRCSSEHNKQPMKDIQRYTCLHGQLMLVPSLIPGASACGYIIGSPQKLSACPTTSAELRERLTGSDRLTGLPMYGETPQWSLGAEKVQQQAPHKGLVGVPSDATVFALILPVLVFVVACLDVAGCSMRMAKSFLEPS